MSFINFFGLRDKSYEEVIPNIGRRTTSNKGITKVKETTNKGKPYKAYLDLGKKKGSNSKFTLHIGYYSTLEEARQARLEFIENLK